MVNPLHQFEIKPIIGMKFADLDISFSNSSLSMIIAVISIVTLFMYGSRKKSLIPGRLQSAIEISYQMIASMIESNVGKKGMKYFPFVFSIFFFVLFGNLIGMIPFMFTFTSHIIVTFSLAMIVILFVTGLGFFIHGTKFFAFFAPKGAPLPLQIILIPIELISYLSRPISLSVRLFANMMAGHTMMKVFAGFCVLLGFLGIAPLTVNIILTGFETVICCLQAYIFTILTCLYISDAVNLH